MMCFDEEPRAVREHDTVKHVEEGCPYRADDVMDAEKAVSTGTTIMAVAYDGGVIMGADSRTSTGDYIANRVSRKVTQVHDRVYVCRSGSAADTQALTGYVQHYTALHAIDKGAPPTVNSVATLFKKLAYNNKDNLMAGLIIGGWDKEAGGQVYVIPLGGSMMKVPYAIGGSGSAYIMGLIDHDWKPNMKEDECRALVKKWISHAMARDGSSGGVVRTFSIKEDSVTEDITYGDALPMQPL